MSLERRKHTINRTDKMERLVVGADDNLVNRAVLGAILKDRYSNIIVESPEEAMELARIYGDLIHAAVLDFDYGVISKMDGIELAQFMISRGVERIILYSATCKEKLPEIPKGIEYVFKPARPDVLLAKIRGSLIAEGKDKAA